MPSTRFWRDLAFLIIFTIFFAWYIFPLGVVITAWWITDAFTIHWGLVKSLADSLKGDQLGLDELPKFLLAMIAAGGLANRLFNENPDKKFSTWVVILTVFILTVSATLCIFGAYTLPSLRGNIDQEYGTGLTAILLEVCVKRFRELSTLLAALIGLGSSKV